MTGPAAPPPAAPERAQPGTVPLVLELAVPPDGVAALRRALAPALGRARPWSMAWHDDAEGTLAHRGLALAAWREGRRTGWRAEALDPSLPPGTPAPVLAEAEAPQAEPPPPLPGLDLPPRLAPVLRLEGRVREGRCGAVALRLVEGRIDGAEPVARLRLSGPAGAATEMGLALAGAGRALVPGRPLAAEALGRAGLPVPRRRLGAPDLPPGLAPGAAFAQAAGHLLGVVLHYAPAAAAGQAGEPVHQMRVALRRLRALVTVFRDVVACPELDQVRPGLRMLAGALGPARDWDVFLLGTGRAVAAAFPHEKPVAALLEGAAAQRAAAYAALGPLLHGPALRELALRLAALAAARPWEAAAPPAGTDLAAFGAAVLARRMRRLARDAGGFATAPEAALHEMRLRAKRLRYAAEVFAPLHPGREARRFLRRLAALQEALGHLNDGAVAALLMQALAAQGGTGLAGGIVRGFVAARADGTREAIARAWKRLRKGGVFWD